MQAVCREKEGSLREALSREGVQREERRFEQRGIAGLSSAVCHSLHDGMYLSHLLPELLPA